MSEHLPDPSGEDRDRPRLDRNAVDTAEPAETIAEPLEEIVEAEAANVAEEVAETVARRRLRPLEGLMLAMLTVSLIIHVLTLTRLFSVRNTLRDEIGSLADSVQAAKSSQVQYDLPINQQIPINLDLPVKQSLTIPIQTEVRIKQDITLPIDTGFGKINIPVPIDAVVPINTTVTLKIYSSDVVHSWWIPKLGGKADATPGHTNQTWFKIPKPGVYWGQCAELCGENHADMRARVIALPVDQYKAWAERQRRDILSAQKELAAMRKAGVGNPSPKSSQ